MKDAETLDSSLRDLLNEPIAIIGLNCQFPGVTADIEDANAFHEMLLGKQTPIREVPRNRWDIDSWYDADRQKEDKIVSRMGGFLEDPQLFDAAFFKIPPIEANQLDPQHRLFLEVSIRALNHANITLDSLRNSATGVYCGISTHDFCQQTIKDKVIFDASTYIGSADSAAAGRLAYFLKLKGPCLAVDTACSSSFSALYLATMALRNRQCDTAIVGGVHFNLSPDVFVGLSKANLLSAMGQCRSFDSEADGYVRSEGCGVVVIKRLCDALRDNNKIHAVIKSIVMNQNGGGNSMPAPHADAQIAMHQSALEEARIHAREIDYIEAHGTGTLAGDSAECNAIQSIHEGHHSTDNPLIIGALKSNLGHTISASGMASLIKVIEAFRHETIPANLHYTRPNTAINPDSIPALMPTEATAFAKSLRKKRYAQVSNFGFTGTNVSAILEEPPTMASNESIIPDNESICFILSANSDVSLQHMLARYLGYLKASPANLHDVCHTLINCRDHFKYRCAIMAQDKHELISKLESGDYTFIQVTVDKNRRTIEADAGQIYEHYLAGASIRTEVAYNQVDLPLYYFDRKAYWYKEMAAETELPEDWYFQLAWQEQSIAHHHFQKPGKRWLLTGAYHLASAFTQQGMDIVLAEDEQTFHNLDGIIFAEGFDVSLADDSDARFELQKTILKQLLTLVQGLNDNNIELPLIVLTSNAIAELAVGNINLEASPLVGFCKTLVLELPQYRTVLIDLDTSDDKDVSARVIDEIQHNHGQQYEHMVAWRDGKRMVCRLRRDTNTLGPAVKPRGFGPGVNPLNNSKDLSRGRYLVTGGLGGLGLTSAETLLSNGAKEVILVSRTIDKPAAKDALQHMQHDYPDRVIRLVSLDITDKEGLKALLLESNNDGMLKGIIHAAGASLSAPLTKHKPEDIDHLLSAKVQGGWYLHELSQHCNLDFFIVYSSVSSVFGSNKESVYAAANSFLDALIAERQRLGLPGCAIQWGPWADVGMAKKRSQYQGMKQAFIHKNQGQAFIQRMLDTRAPALTIISPDYLKFMLDFVPRPLPVFYQCLKNTLCTGQKFSAVLANRVAVKQSSDFSERCQGPWIASLPLAKTAHLPSWLTNYFNMDETRKSAACKDLISSICKDILEIPKTDKLDEEEGFSEIGLDSLMMTELASRINLALSLNIAITIAFDYPTINKLSQHIESELAHHPLTIQSASTPAQDMMVTNDAIAVIGMSCTFPGAPDITAFEHMLDNGLNGIRDIPPERWDNSQYYDAAPKTPDKSFINKLGLIDDIEYFDPGFFGISRREAPFVEPQQRLFLEQCSNAIEHANYPALSLRGSLTGVFAGTGSTQEYYTLLEKSGLPRNEPGLFPVTGKAMNMIPARVAYTFDFKGPALSIDTACSSSLVAIHYACQSLKNREIDYALAGGVNILLRPEGVVNLCNAQALSADGQCKTFDEQADGYVRAEGCGVLFLKRLDDAVRDQDNILAVIKGSAINNDGKSAGLTMPNGKSQEDVMLKALDQAGLSGSDISYIEAHGTGTPLGDPIEVHAINKVYGSQRDKTNPLYIGAVKTNIGHLESAAGVASMIKVILGLQKKKIYQTLNFHRLNPNIKIGDTRIALQQMNWNTPEKRNCAGVSAFGFSGTNAHVLLQDYPASVKQKTTQKTETSVLVLSAKSEAALDKLATRYREFLKTTDSNFDDICFTAATCRDHHPFRLAVAASSAIEASQLFGQGTYASLDVQGNRELELLVAQYLDGKQTDWASYYKNSGAQANKINLPNYSFDRSKFWLDTTSHRNVSNNLIHPLLGRMISMPGEDYLFHHQPDWTRINYLNQYRLFEKAIFPAAAGIESFVAAAKSILKSPAFSLEQFSVIHNLYLNLVQDVQLQAKPGKDGHYSLHLFAKQDEHWQPCYDVDIQTISRMPDSIDIAALQASFASTVDITQFYKSLADSPLAYGPEFQIIQEARASSNASLCKMVLTKAYGEQQYCYHPVMLESAIQSLFLIQKDYDADTTWLPHAFSRMTVFQDAPRTVWVHAVQRDSEQGSEFCADLMFYDSAGLLIARIEALRLRKTTQSPLLSCESVLQHLYSMKWKILNSNIPGTARQPPFWVISKDEARARNLFADSDYQLVDHINKLDNIKDKNIVFLYDEQQFTELFHCCQQLFRTPPASFILITENAWAVTRDSDKVNPHHSMAGAFWKSFANELALQKNYTIDTSSGQTLKYVLDYVFNTTSKETQFAVRDAIYVPRLEKEPIPADDMPQHSLFDREASYLITGGTGGLAKPLIDYLIRNDVRHIILTSRAECRPETQVLIQEARKKRVSIKHYSADVSNFEHMKQIIETCAQSAHMLKGVFHLAGVIHDDLIVNLCDETVEQVLKTKVTGALNLHELTKHIQLDLFVLFSSSASILGSRGQANYVAANGFLDGLAQLRQQQHLPALAINWGAFHTTGMAAKTSLALQRRGLILMSPESLGASLDILLPIQSPQLLLCPINWDIYFHNTPKSSVFFKQINKTKSPDPHFLTFLGKHNEKELTAILRQALADIAAEVLEFENSEEVGIKNDLFAMGMDSLTSLELRNRIHDKLQCPALSLPIEYFINEPRIDKIAINIAHELRTILAPIQSQPQVDFASPESIALCDTQYQFWIVNKLAGSFNCAMQIQLQGKLHKEYLSRAFEFAINQHSVFWLDFSDEVPVQTLKRQGQFQLIYEDITSIYNADKVNDIFYKNVMHKISLSAQPLIRIYLYKLKHEHHEVHIVIPHIILDNGSYRILFEQFKKNYDLLLQGKNLVAEPETITYLDYVKQNNHHYEKDLTNKINFWKIYNKGFQRLSFGHAHHLPDAARQPKHLYHYPMDDQLITQFKNWHQEQNMNVSTGLIAACQIVFYKLSSQNKIPIILLHTGREGSPYRSVVGLFSEHKRINITLNEDYKFIDFLKSIEGELSKTAPFQKCSQFIKNSGLRDAQLSIGQYCMYLYNKLALSKQFKKTRLHSITRDYYLKNLSVPGWRLIKFKIKSKLNKACKLNLPLLEPDRLRVLINITPSFFIKEPLDPQFSGLVATIPNHYGSVDRPVSNQTLWLYFTKDQYNNYRLSINGPLTVACKNQIAEDLKEVMSKVLENNQCRIMDLIRD